MKPDSPKNIIPLGEANRPDTGGKASGLARLSSLGFNVPDGFVVTGQADNNELRVAYEAMGSGKVAVRSSAQGEDGHDNSCAGQYDTLLNIEGLEALQDAIAQCRASLTASRAEAYQQHAGLEAGRMNIVVQQMVDAASAGVIFTADPVSGRRDRLVLDVVAGLGEALVSGDATPDHYELAPDDSVVVAELAGENPVLTPGQIQQLATEARAIATAMNEPVDLEWAFNQQGTLYWLQARPITTLPSDLNEFDTPVHPDDILTTCNIAEMMPNAVCPLSLSVTLRGIEHGFQHMDVLMGACETITAEFTQVSSRYGHWFINLSGKVAGSGHVLGMNAEEAGYSICGQRIPELQSPPKQGLMTRLRGGWRFYRYLASADPVIDDFEQRMKAFFRVKRLDDPAAMIRHIDELVLWVLEVEEVHVRSSSSSAVSGGILQGIITGGQEPTQEQMGEIARLMSGATGVESALLVEELDAIMRRIAADKSQAETFRAFSAQDGCEWLQQKAPSDIRRAFEDFLRKHGHRGFRELCVRELGWADNPAPLVTTLQASIAAHLTGGTTKPAAAAMKTQKAVVRWLLPKVHNGIRRRERTKSLLAYITREVGRAYRHLGSLLHQQGIFPDEDLVFFFTHEELLASHGSFSREQVNHAQLRRRALDFQNRLSFAEICIGPPLPVETAVVPEGNEKLLKGRPVSQGIVEGICRVAMTPAEASQLQPGEILIAPITDVAWTPYFSLIAGLATDVGSSVSHGAVIAREYGLPAVVNLKTATRLFATGDRVRLDGDRGILEKC